LSALLTQTLRAFRFVPDRGLLEFPQDLLQAFALGIDVKDTP
jgi:hypothetical protein